jgi:hypothetical protein
MKVLQIVLRNGDEELARRLASTQEGAAAAAIEMIEEFGALQPGEKVIVSEVDE